MAQAKHAAKNKTGTPLKYTFRSDVLFKMLFVRNPDLLKRLVAVLLGIPLASIEDFQTVNTEMPPEEIGTKFCRLDINMIVDVRQVNLEVQVEDEGNYPERCMFHWAKMYVGYLPSGKDFSLLPQTIVISIMGFGYFDCEEVHSEFAVMEVKRHELLSDKQRYHFFELPKLPDVELIDGACEKDLWLALFNAETVEELEKLISSGGEIMTQAVGAYHSITADKQFQYLETLRAKARHDEAQALSNARRQEREKWQGVVADKDTALANEKAENEKLRQQLAALKANQN
ncbi:MAG: Rpn family recombination-promoting nuclease/putative transposase [Defluviitaleaceae bacterium]|nr:Rpn family recombination-promoting nuclease/putative transposase [Defluviitaleaceae bacterium]